MIDLDRVNWNWTRRWRRITREGTSDETWTLAELHDEPVLLLVGDPGAGKSTELRKEREYTETVFDERRIISLDSKSGVSSDTVFLELWFESRRWKNWLESTGLIFVFIDGFDEFIHRIPGVDELILMKLQDDLEDFPDAKKRLRLRIASRTIGLPSNFPRRLGRITQDKDANVTVSYELCPLSDNDIADATATIGIETMEFTKELNRRGFVSLARRPKLLKWLIAEYYQSRVIQSSYDEVYWTGLCQLLANDSHISTPETTLWMAARVAFVMAFSGRTYLTMGTIINPETNQTLGLNAFLEPSFSTNSSFAPSTLAGLENLQMTELFTGSRDHFTWSELPDMEYLAAKYAIHSGLPTKQLLGLIRNDEDDKEQVVPELANVAAHMAGLHDDIFDAILEHDPSVLIRSDSALKDDHARHRVTKALLDAYELGTLVKSRWYPRDHFALLAFDGIIDLLRPYITDTHLRRVTREIAIDIIRDCKLNELVDVLGSIVRSNDECEVLRRSAAWALYDLGTKNAVEHLACLLIEPPLIDDLQELKGLALRAVWPNMWSLEQVLPHITPPDSQVLGAYRLFLSQEFVGGVQDHELTTVYDWIDTQDSWNDGWYDLEGIIESLLDRAVDIFPNEAAVHFVITNALKLGNYFSFGPSHTNNRDRSLLIAESLENRRLVVDHLITLNPGHEETSSRAFLAVSSLYSLLPKERINEDVAWIANRAIAENLSGEIREAWFRLLRSFQLVFDRDSLNLVYDIYQDPRYSTHLKQVFVVELNSEEAESQRLWWRAERCNSDPDSEPEDSEWFYTDIKGILEDIPLERNSRWFYLDQLLRRTSPGRASSRGSIDTCEGLENWHLVGDTELGTLVQSAREYLQHYEPICECLGTGKFYLSDQAAYRAMTLLLQHSEERLLFLKPQDWQRLGPVVLSMAPKNSESTPALFSHLLQEAINNGFVWRPWLDRMIHAGHDTDFYIRPFLMKLLEVVGDTEINEMVESLISRTTPADLISPIATILGSKRGELVTDRLLLLLRDQELDRNIRIRLYCTALDFFSSHQWGQLVRGLEEDHILFDQVFLDYTYSDRTSSSLAWRIQEAEIADLYCRLAQAFPPSEDINPVGMHVVTDRESVGIWREGLLDHLVSRGTWDAVSELRRLEAKLPTIEWLPIRAAQAENRARQQTWKPHQVDDLLRILPGSGARIVRSEDQLQAVIAESLQRLNGELQSESPAAHDLWTSNPGRRDGEPKDEAFLSDYIKRFLDRDIHTIPVFSNREVNNRIDERNDIYVECNDSESGQKLKVVCEVKGCWNRGVLTNMKTQLADRYMATTNTKHGIYIVGFFDCDEWPYEGKRRHDSANHTLESLRESLDTQAFELAEKGLSVIPVVLDCRKP